MSVKARDSTAHPPPERAPGEAHRGGCLASVPAVLLEHPNQRGGFFAGLRRALRRRQGRWFQSPLLAASPRAGGFARGLKPSASTDDERWKTGDSRLPAIIPAGWPSGGACGISGGCTTSRSRHGDCDNGGDRAPGDCLRTPLARLASVWAWRPSSPTCTTSSCPHGVPLHESPSLEGTLRASSRVGRWSRRGRCSLQRCQSQVRAPPQQLPSSAA